MKIPSSHRNCSVAECSQRNSDGIRVQQFKHVENSYVLDTGPHENWPWIFIFILTTRTYKTISVWIRIRPHQILECRSVNVDHSIDLFPMHLYRKNITLDFTMHELKTYTWKLFFLNIPVPPSLLRLQEFLVCVRATVITPRATCLHTGTGAPWLWPRHLLIAELTTTRASCCC